MDIDSVPDEIFVGPLKGAEIEYFTEGKISDDLLEVFWENHKEVSDSAKVIQKDESHWEIIGEKHEYLVRKGGQEYMVYERIFPVKEFQTQSPQFQNCIFILKLARTLGLLNYGEIPNEDYTKADLERLCRSLVEKQRFDILELEGSWTILPKVEDDPSMKRIAYGMPSDAWVDLVGDPTYLAISVLTYVMYEYPEIVDKIDGYMDVLKEGYEFSTHSNYYGHGFSRITKMISTLDMFHMSLVLKHLNENPDFCPKAVRVIKNLYKTMKQDIKTGNTSCGYCGDMKTEYRRMIALLEGHDFHKEELITEFKPLEDNEDTRRITDEIEYTLKVLVDGDIPDDDYTSEDLKDLCDSLVKEQRFDLEGFEGSWTIFPYREDLPDDNEGEMPPWAWYQYVEQPTHRVISLLTYVLYEYPEIAESIEGYEEALKTGYEVSAKDGVFSWSAAEINTASYNLEIFGRSKVIKHVLDNKDFSPNMYSAIKGITHDLFKRGLTKSGNYRRTHRKILKMLEGYGLCREE